MPQVQANGVTIEYDIRGPEDGEAVLLIMGTAGQLTLWPVDFCDQLAAKGFRVIRYDHRDTGLSTRFDDAGFPDIPGIFAALAEGRTPTAPYTLDDLAADAVGLLAALGIDKAHIVGGSMGGMVAQLVAADHPDRVLSLTSIMSTSANPALPQPAPEVIQKLSSPAPDPLADRDAYVAHNIANARITGSPGFPETDEALRAQFLRDLDRSYNPAGFYRHYAAVLVAKDRRPKLAAIRTPTVVIHGDADPLVPWPCGRDTADNIPDAQFTLVPGMGHDLPPGLFQTFVEAIDSVAVRARV